MKERASAPVFTAYLAPSTNDRNEAHAWCISESTFIASVPTSPPLPRMRESCSAVSRVLSDNLWSSSRSRRRSKASRPERYRSRRSFSSSDWDSANQAEQPPSVCALWLRQAVKTFGQNPALINAALDSVVKF